MEREILPTPYRGSDIITVLPPNTAPSQYRLPPNTASLLILPPSQYRLPPNTASLPIPPPSQYSLPPNTASLPIPPPSQCRLPPNTASHFKSQIGFYQTCLLNLIEDKIWLLMMYKIMYISQSRCTTAFAPHALIWPTPLYGLYNLMTSSETILQHGNDHGTV